MILCSQSSKPINHRGRASMSAVVLTEKESEKRYVAASRLASNQVDLCVANPAEYLKNPMTLLCAEFEFKNQPVHQCYWNNRFCIAVMCGLWENKQRLAAWCAVSNGLNGYWEWQTHSGYDMAAVLKYLGIVADDFSAPKNGDGYCTLDAGIAAKLVEKFELPTTHFSMQKKLTVEENRKREIFNKKYPHHAVL